MIRDNSVEQLEEVGEPLVHGAKYPALLSLIDAPEQLNPLLQELRGAFVLRYLVNVVDFLYACVVYPDYHDALQELY